MNELICFICQLGIDLDKEFAEFIHYKKKGIKKSSAYYHVNCFREKLGGGRENRKLQAKANLILDKVAERMM